MVCDIVMQVHDLVVKERFECAYLNAVLSSLAGWIKAICYIPYS